MTLDVSYALNGINMQFSGSFLETKTVYSDDFNQLMTMTDPC